MSIRSDIIVRFGIEKKFDLKKMNQCLTFYGEKSVPRKKSQESSKCFELVPDELEELDKRLAEQEAGFRETLFEYINTSRKKPSEVYQNAHISPALHAKIKKTPEYKASAQIILAYALGLKLSLEQTENLLRRAGYALIPGTQEIIIRYHIDHKKYSVDSINDWLLLYGQKKLGSI